MTNAARHRWYMLIDKIAVPCDINQSTDYITRNRTVARDEIEGTIVSTVFLGLDHQHNEVGPPLLFETMLFGGGNDGHLWRTSTWKDALAMHENAIRYVRDNAVTRANTG